MELRDGKIHRHNPFATRTRASRKFGCIHLLGDLRIPSLRT
jgi:hypothetical protein